MILLTKLLLGISMAMSSAVAEKNNIVLTDSNTIVLRGPVSDDSMNDLKLQLINKTSSLFGPKVIYLVLDTPGGSVTAGNSFIDFVNGLEGVEVKTLTLFSASMGFHFVQNLSERLILKTGTLMSHRASVQIGGELGGEMDTRLNYIKRIIYKMDHEVSKRAKMAHADYSKLISDELWLDGEDSVKYRFADKVVTAQCSKSLSGTYSQIVPVMFFDVKVTWSKCPLLSAPLKVEINALAGATPNGKKELNEMLQMLFTNKKQFVTEYIKNTSSSRSSLFRETFKIGQ